MEKNINYKLALYLSSLLLFSFFFLFIKYPVANDSTISEWLINYEGGFTKRGAMGQIAIYFSRFFETELRWAIYLLQSAFCTIYFILLYNFFKNINFDRISTLAIFTPIFILYPVAEIEVLARKEVIIFSIYIAYLMVPRINFFKDFSLLIFFVLSMLVWEPTIFFVPIIVLIELIENKISKLNFNFFKVIFLLLPGILIGFYFAISPLTNDQHDIMRLVLKNEFNEGCYMSCELLKTKSSIMQHFEQYKVYTLETTIRYILIIIIGFFPLFILLKNSKLKNKNIFFLNKFNNLLFPTLICLIPVIVLFAMGYDWGRWVNIAYVFTAIFYFYLFKNNFINLNNGLKNHYVNKLNKKTFIVLFIIFCFGWNQKTAITGDVASFPGYRIPYKTLSYIIRGHL